MQLRPSGLLLLAYAGVLTWWITGGSGTWTWLRVALLVFFASGVAAGLGVLGGFRWAQRWGLVFGGVGLTIGVVLFIARVVFVIRHGGMDCYDCNGSPLAFLIGWVAHQVLVTLPSGLVTLLLWNERSRQQGE